MSLRNRSFPRKIQIAFGIAFLFLTSACNIDPTDYDNLRAHAVVDFIAYGQPYHREWDFTLHRRGVFSIDLGPADRWAVTQAGILVAAPDGKGLLVGFPANLSLVLPVRRTMEFTNPVTLTDNAVVPTVFETPPSNCPHDFLVKSCVAKIQVRILPRERTITAIPAHSWDAGDNFVRSEITGKLIDLSPGTNALVSARAFSCPAEKWKRAAGPEVIAALARADLLGNAVPVLHHLDSDPLLVACFGTGHWDLKSSNIEGSWLEYDGIGSWKMPASRITEHLYKIEKINDDTSTGAYWNYVNSISLASGKKLYFKMASPYRNYLSLNAFMFIDSDSGELVVVPTGDF
jgi:hypothetical protein